MKKHALPVKIYEIKITLKNSNPPIWRQVQVRSDITLAKLHQVIQIAMGWEDCHLHAFKIDISPLKYSQLSDDCFFDEALDEAMVLLKEVAGVRKTFSYEYDLGDGWLHTIKIEKSLALDDQIKTPRCIDGQGACPPEECGGLWGYYRILEKLAGPPCEEKDDAMEWVGKDFDPDVFDLEKVNTILARL